MIRSQFLAALLLAITIAPVAVADPVTCRGPAVEAFLPAEPADYMVGGWHIAGEAGRTTIAYYRDGRFSGVSERAGEAAVAVEGVWETTPRSAGAFELAVWFDAGEPLRQMMVPLDRERLCNQTAGAVAERLWSGEAVLPGLPDERDRPAYDAFSGVWHDGYGGVYDVTVDADGAFSGEGLTVEGLVAEIEGYFSLSGAVYRVSAPEAGLSLGGVATWDGPCHLAYTTINPDGESANLTGRFHLAHAPGEPCPASPRHTDLHDKE